MLDDNQPKRSTVKRLRDFYDEHPEACNAAIFFASFAVSYTVFRKLRKRANRVSPEPVGATFWSRDDGLGSLITVSMNDGSVFPFFRNLEELAAS